MWVAHAWPRLHGPNGARCAAAGVGRLGRSLPVASLLHAARVVVAVRGAGLERHRGHRGTMPLLLRRVPGFLHVLRWARVARLVVEVGPGAKALFRGEGARRNTVHAETPSKYGATGHGHGAAPDPVSNQLPAARRPWHPAAGLGGGSDRARRGLEERANARLFRLRRSTTRAGRRKGEGEGWRARGKVTLPGLGALRCPARPRSRAAAGSARRWLSSARRHHCPGTGSS